jgi:hypothetical protein
MQDVIASEEQVKSIQRNIEDMRNDILQLDENIQSTNSSVASIRRELRTELHCLKLELSTEDRCMRSELTTMIYCLKTDLGTEIRLARK